MPTKCRLPRRRRRGQARPGAVRLPRLVAARVAVIRPQRGPRCTKHVTSSKGRSSRPRREPWQHTIPKNRKRPTMTAMERGVLAAPAVQAGPSGIYGNRGQCAPWQCRTDHGVIPLACLGVACPVCETKKMGTSTCSGFAESRCRRRRRGGREKRRHRRRHRGIRRHVGG